MSGKGEMMEPLKGDTKDAMESPSVYTKQQRIATMAARHSGVSFTSLAYHVDVAWMQEAYRRTRKDAASGVDEMTAKEYAVGLDERLAGLLERFKSGTYYAPPVRRVYIPKDGARGEKRPIGIPTLEDRILQRAVVMLLEPLYENDFLECSYGFRPKRSQHMALEALWQAAMNTRGEVVVLEIDIRKFFDTLKHEHLRNALQHRVCDGVVRRAIGKWLNAGVQERGQVHYPEDGSPQGGVVSPLLSNIYLHEVLDSWFEREVNPRLTGKATLVRFADDAVVVFENRQDAQRVQAVLPKRLDKYGLHVHPEKTRLVEFRRPTEGCKEPGTFNFLGFTHYWAKSHKGNWTVRRKTSKQRLARGIKRVYENCRENMHEPVKDQWENLKSKVRGHYQYYGITANIESLKAYLRGVCYAWRKWLNRRSNEQDMDSEKFGRLLARYPLPKPKIYHSFA